MRDIGELLRRTRQEKGLSLRDVQLETKIRTKYLEALERGDDTVIPGEVYCRGFLKTYANFLGLDGRELAARYAALKQAERQQAEGRREGEPQGGPPVAPGSPRRARATSAPPPRKLAPARAGPRSRGSSSPITGFVLVLLLLSAAMAAWWAWQSGTLSALLPSLAPSPRPGPGPGDGGPGATAEGREPAPGGPGEESGPVPPPGGDGSGIVTLEKVTVRPGRVVIYVKGGERLELRASFRDRCWVRVTLDGQTREESTFSGGEERSWTAARTASLRLGNAAALTLIVNGEEAGSLGRAGEAVTVSIEMAVPR